MEQNETTNVLKDLQHFIGVIEDINDPLALGRVRVRAFGIHHASRAHIPTEDLPWATPIMPFNSASMSGIGISPTGALRGSWVFGLFIDGDAMQQPIILGTMVGQHQNMPDPNVGFSDPSAQYPIKEMLRQSDVNKLARGEAAAGEESLAQKREGRSTGIPTAVPPIVEEVRDLDGPVTKDDKGSVVGHPTNNVSGVDPDTFYFRNRWDEPNPRAGGQGSDTCFLDDKGNSQPWQGRVGTKKPNKSVYPSNHVYRSESGHVMEYDDTEGGERIHQYHKKGTFYEIQPDGTRVTKVVGDDYEIFMKGKNVVIEGNMNLTVKGDVRLFVENNLYQEVKGNYHLRVDGDMVTKIQGNEQKVVLTNQATQINKNRSTRITGNDKHETVGDTHSIYTGTANSVHKSNVDLTITGFERRKMSQSFTCITGGNTNFIVGSNHNIKAVSNVNIHTESMLNMDANLHVTIDTPTQFLVGTNIKPTQTTVQSNMIDLNP